MRPPAVAWSAPLRSGHGGSTNSCRIDRFGLNRQRDWTVGPLVKAALELSAHPRAPRLAYLGTAMGDRIEDVAMVHGAFTGTDVTVSTVRVMPQPNVPDLREALLRQDVIYVRGGSVAGFLALWRLHGSSKSSGKRGTSASC
jgi:hypothetical protein